MAEKEERIYIDVENDNLDRLKHLSMTRQEAIERMAKSVYYTFSGCTHITPFEQVEDKYKQGYYKRAEAALNALLEAEK